MLNDSLKNNKNTTNKNTTTENTPTENTLTKNTVSKNTTSKNTTSKNTAELGVAVQLLLNYADQHQLRSHIFEIHSQHGDDTVILSRELMPKVFPLLKTDPSTSMEMMVDLTAVDWLPRIPRFEVVYHFKSLSLGHRLRVKIPLEEDDAWLPSIVKIWQAADWYERECWEMYGIVFKDHPNLKPLLLYEGFQGWPLRKDYDKNLAQPLVEMRPVRERYDYQEKYQPIERKPAEKSLQKEAPQKENPQKENPQKENLQK